MNNIIHITPHLGGGVGKALSTLISASTRKNSNTNHKIIILEKPIKDQFVRKIKSLNIEIYVQPDQKTINKLLSECDIVQVEWWNNPAMIEFLCLQLSYFQIRLIVWCHISGLYNPIIPTKLIEVSDKFIFTSKCSYQSIEVQKIYKIYPNKLKVITSGSGEYMDTDLSLSFKDELRVGYLGSLNFAKLHPDFMSFLIEVNDPNFQINLIGDLVNKEILEFQSFVKKRNNILNFKGYIENIKTELNNINVIAYLLNPYHYGTAENALIECMAMGIVPIVLNNPAESNIVNHLETGIIINNKKEFGEAIKWLKENPKERHRLGLNAASYVVNNYNIENTYSKFKKEYSQLIKKEEKKIINFNEIFGSDRSNWFLSCQANPEHFNADGSVKIYNDELMNHIIFEETKGSVMHFSNYFNESIKLKEWSKSIRKLINNFRKEINRNYQNSH
jgi:glycosyltransferase involved in cell wall biosynthesis